jgi:hypothetical protein
LRHIGRLLELGWRAVTETHTALWVFEMIVTPAVLTALLGWFFEHSLAVIGGFFLLALTATVLITLALLGHWRETHPAGTPAPVSDQTEWTIAELFFHICPGLERDKENSTLRRDIAKTVLDELCSGTIKMRGRKIDGLTTKRLPLTWIDADYWRHVLLTYWFLDREESVLDARNEKTGVEYADLRIDQAAALKIWPLPIPLRDAARMAYERTRGTLFAEIAERFGETPNGILRYYEHHFFLRYPIYAERTPSTISELIPPGLLAQLRILDGRDEIGYNGSKVATYVNPKVHLSSVEECVKWANDPEFNVNGSS